MTSNVHAPSLSPPSENGSKGDDSIRFITLFGATIAINGFNEGNLSSANIHSNEKPSQLISPPSSPPLPPTPSTPTPFNLTKRTHAELDFPLYGQNEEMQPQFGLPALDKRPKGRRIGSKNKPKPPSTPTIPTTHILREMEDFSKPIVLIVSAGMDIIKAIINFGRERDVNISVHHASGFISEVILSNPLSPSNGLAFWGKLRMLYLSGFYTNNFSSSTPHKIPYASFTIQFSRESTPQLFRGLVGAKLIAAEPVRVIASMIKKNEYHEMENLITHPNVQPVIKTRTNSYAAIVNNALNGMSNNAIYHPGFSIRASSSFQMNTQPLTTPFDPVDVSMR